MAIKEVGTNVKALKVNGTVNQVNLNKLTKAQLICLVSGIIDKLDLIDTFADSYEEDYQRTKYEYYSARGNGLRSASKYIGEVILDILGGVNRG